MKSRLVSAPLKSIALIATMVCGVLLLSACNTVEGAGKDIERAGEKVQESAN